MASKPSVYVVTGVAGFIGSHIAHTLLNQGATVVGLDNFASGFKPTIDFLKNASSSPDQFTFIEGDIRDLETCQRVVSGADYVLHQAALGSVPRSMTEPALYHDNNITGTFNMLFAARDAKVKRFVFASSSSVYGDTLVLPKVETMIGTPKSPYALTKWVGEGYCRLFWDCYSLPTIALRYFNVFGARQNPNSQYAAVIPLFTKAGLANTPAQIHGDGGQTRDFTYIDNVVKANLAACHADQSWFGQAFNIGCGVHISVGELAQKIKGLTGSTADPVHTPSRPGDVRDSLADVRKSIDAGLVQDPIPLDEGLASTVNWYRSHR